MPQGQYLGMMARRTILLLSSWDARKYMGRRRNQRGSVADLLDGVAAMPWPAGASIGVIGFLLLRFVLLPWLMGPLASSLGTLVALMWLAICLLGAMASAIKSRKRERLLDTRTNLESLSASGWRNFERLVGEAFRRQGYVVDENDWNGPDGGIDLVLHKDGQRTLVQCKQWKRQQVGVAIVREMYGLLVHHDADAVKIVSTGNYTEAAEAFTEGKPIELISGEKLLAMIHAVQPAPAPGTSMQTHPRQEPVLPGTTFTTTCQRCGAAMVERRNRQTGAVFMGCSRFPACRNTA